MKKEDLRIRKTKANLYRGLLQLMEEKTFEEIKVTDICSISMINRSTFYDHFNDKFELLASLIDDLREETLSHIEISTKTNNMKEYYMAIIKQILDYLSKNLDVYSALSVIKKNNHSIAYDMIYDAALENVKKELKENFVNHSTIPIDVLALFYVSGMMKVLEESVKDPSHYDQEKLLSYIDSLIPEFTYLEPIYSDKK